MILSNKKINDVNVEELAFYTQRRATVNYLNTRLAINDMRMTRCFSKMSDGTRCTRMTTIWPYCMCHTVHQLRLLADLQFGQFGLIAFDPFCSINADANPIVFYANDIIAPYSSCVASFSSNARGRDGINVITISEELTAKQMNDRYPKDIHAPFAVNTSLNAAAAELEPAPAPKRRRNDVRFYDALFMRAIGSLANTTTAAECNAELQVMADDVVVVATKDIRNTESILIAYGDEYLKAMANNQMPTVTYEPAMPEFTGASLYRE